MPYRVNGEESINDQNELESKISGTSIQKLDDGTTAELSADDEIAIYEGTSLEYKRFTIQELNDSNVITSTATVSDLNDIGNVDAPAPANGQMLAYNGTSSNWEPTQPTPELPVFPYDYVAAPDQSGGFVAPNPGEVYLTANAGNLGFPALVISGFDKNGVDREATLIQANVTPATITLYYDGGTYSVLGNIVDLGAEFGGGPNGILGIPVFAGVGAPPAPGEVSLGMDIRGPVVLNELFDVNVPFPTNGDVLTYNFSSGDWEAAAPSAGTVASLNDIGDVDVPTPTDGQLLVFSSSTSNWTTGNAPAEVGLRYIYRTTTGVPAAGEIKITGTSILLSKDDANGMSQTGFLGSLSSSFFYEYALAYAGGVYVVEGDGQLSDQGTFYQNIEVPLSATGNPPADGDEVSLTIRRSPNPERTLGGEIKYFSNFDRIDIGTNITDEIRIAGTGGIVYELANGGSLTVGDDIAETTIEGDLTVTNGGVISGDGSGLTNLPAPTINQGGLLYTFNTGGNTAATPVGQVRFNNAQTIFGINAEDRNGNSQLPFFSSLADGGTYVIFIKHPGGAAIFTGVYTDDTPSVFQFTGGTFEGVEPAGDDNCDITITPVSPNGSVASLNDIGDVNAPSPTTGDVITWTGTQYAAVQPTATDTSVLGGEIQYLNTVGENTIVIGDGGTTIQAGDLGSYDQFTGTGNVLNGTIAYDVSAASLTTPSFVALNLGQLGDYDPFNDTGSIFEGNVSYAGNSGSPEVSVDADLTVLAGNVISGDGSGLTGVSDTRWKTGISTVSIGMTFIEQLNPIRFKYQKPVAGVATINAQGQAEWDYSQGWEERDGKWRYGFSAQEIAAIEVTMGAEHAVVVDDNPEQLQLRPEGLMPIMVNALKELQTRLDTLEAENQSLRDRVDVLEGN